MPKRTVEKSSRLGTPANGPTRRRGDAERIRHRESAQSTQRPIARRFPRLPSAFCLLPSAFCRLPSAFRLPPSNFILYPFSSSSLRLCVSAVLLLFLSTRGAAD